MVADNEVFTTKRVENSACAIRDDVPKKSVLEGGLSGWLGRARLRQNRFKLFLAGCIARREAIRISV